MNQSRLWTIGATLLIVALLAGTWFLGVAPRLSDARDADTAREQAVTLNNMHRQTLAALQADHERKDEILAELAEAHSVVPETPEPTALLTSLDAMARQAGVRITNLSFQGAALYVTPDEAPAEFLSAANELVAAGLYVIPASIEATGSSASLLNFIAALQSNQRYLHVHQGQILTNDDGSTLTISAELFGISEAVAETPETPAPAAPSE